MDIAAFNQACLTAPDIHSLTQCFNQQRLSPIEQNPYTERYLHPFHPGHLIEVGCLNGEMIQRYYRFNRWCAYPTAYRIQAFQQHPDHYVMIGERLLSPTPNGQHLTGTVPSFDPVFDECHRTLCNATVEMNQASFNQAYPHTDAFLAAFSPVVVNRYSRFLKEAFVILRHLVVVGKIYCHRHAILLRGRTPVLVSPINARFSPLFTLR